MTAAARLGPVLVAAGAVAGLAYFALLEERALAGLPAALQRLATYAAIVAFPAFGLMAGPLPPRRAAPRAAGLALAAAALATLAGTRFPEPGSARAMLEPTGQGLILGPFLALAALALPVATAAGERGWRDHARLLPLGWTAAVKTIVALLFFLLFWLVYWLSDELLSLVGIDLLQRFERWDPGPYLLSGAVLGAALAVACEAERVVRTALGLFLRLLRLLLVPVTAVTAVFVLATLVQGLGTVFERRSAAATMMAMAAGAVLLLAAALGLAEEEGEAGPLTRWAARVMGAVLPVVAAIAAYAIWVRVGAYGWTPPRVLAALCAVVVVLFTLPVAAAALPARPGWPGRTLEGFVLALLAALGLGALWFTPLLDAQRISAASQLARLESGDADPLVYDFWPLARQWGHAGRRALAAYAATDPPGPVARRIALAREAETRWAANEPAREVTAAARWDALRGRIARVPAGAPALPEAAAFAPEALPRLAPDALAATCGPGEPAPRCVAVAGDALPAVAGEEWLLVAQDAPGAWLRAHVLHAGADGPWRAAPASVGPVAPPDADVVALARAGEYDWDIPAIRVLRIGPARLMPQTEERE